MVYAASDIGQGHAGWKDVAVVGWLKKLLGKEETREEWLAAHPGKESKKSEAPPVDLEQEARTRATMEGEMSASREKRDS